LCYAPSSPAGGAGMWPDALAPLTDPFGMTAEFRRAVRNRPLWVDIFVPASAAPGEYSGSLRVTHHAKPVAEIKVRLKVHDFALPEETHLITYMGLSGRRIARFHEVKEGTEEAKRLLMRYHEFLYANRMEPWFNELLGPEIERRGEQLAVSFDRVAYEQYLKVWKTKRVVLETAPARLRRLLRGEPFSQTFNHEVKSYLAQVAAWFRANGWLDRLVFNSPIDEPNTAEAYEETRRWARLVREAAPGVPFLVTEAPVPDRPEWGPLTGFATHFSVHGNALNRPDVRQAIAVERKKGGEITWYISCDQKYPQPNYFIDAPAMDPVMVPWISWKLGLDGILYWALDFWSQTVDPWLNPVTYLSGYFCSGGWVLNGEGSLLYPGSRTRRYTGQQNVDGPVSSIRFELLREGIEDYECLWMLAGLGDRELADRAAARLVRSVREFSRDPAALLQARAEIASRLEQLSRRAAARPLR
ncbi:MAG: glycoside hydrolase domain-containing protein, partial [Bryobacteraceae bacterium]